jgi:multidrug resistance efflux pump
MAALTFIHAEDQELVAAFPQNGLQNIKAGYEAEITFDAIPGRAFKGKVKQVLTTVAQGQLLPNPSGKLIDFDEIAMLNRQGRVPVKIEISDDLSEFQLPAGGKAEVAVYSEHWQAVSIVRRILLRMKSWQKYVFIGG